ncbi:MAG: response regulator transcription factor, partial [Actinomycetes bacterium]
ALHYEGWEVEVAHNGHDAVAKFDEIEPDVVVLDIMLPDIDGLEVLRRMRGDLPRLPVLFLTAKDALEDRIAGLTAGGDDYVTKPFSLEEVIARIRAVLRRSAGRAGAAGQPSRLRFADLELDPSTREVRRGGEDIELTRTEFSLLELFLLNPRQVLTRSVIFERVWGYDFGFGSNSLDVYVGYLRRKTESGGEPRLIHTMRGVGYALRETPP